MAGVAWLPAAAPRRLVGYLALASLLLSLGVEGVRSAGAPLRPYTLRPDDEAALALLRARAPIAGRVLVHQGPLDVLAYAVAHEPGLPAVTFRAAAQPNVFAGWDPVLGCFLGLRRSFTLEDALARLQLYAIEWVVVPEESRAAAVLDALPADRVAERLQAGALRVWRLATPTGYVAGGPGELRALPGRLELTGLAGPVTLRWHFVPGLRALEDDRVRVEQVPVPGAPAGFIRVDPAGRERVTLVWDE
jgi:hypothetical protein